jgi:Spy/CpxP family protein refolding chaperone
MSEKKALHRTLLVAAAVVVFGIGAVAVRAGSGHAGGMLAGLHGHCGHMEEVHGKVEAILDKLNLTPEQRAHVDRAHAIIEDKIREHESTRMGDMDGILSAIGDGTLDRMQVQQKIDSHVEQFRRVAYDVSDELVGFVNSLDAAQRAMLKDELTKLHESMQ